MSNRIGIGYDIHRLVEGRKLFLGGIEFPYGKGCLGHSDGDPVLHAVCDALLGALGLGDIGEHFPDTDRRYKGIPSSRLVEEVRLLLDKSGYRIDNMDIIVIAEEPKLFPFKKEMKKKICSLLGIEESRLNIKAKTNEELDALGRREAVACWAGVSLSGRV
jgi:2-C-methyl-D-erythritol 2,4-cyclodiphosphate synthase